MPGLLLEAGSWDGTGPEAETSVQELVADWRSWRSEAVAAGGRHLVPGAPPPLPVSRPRAGRAAGYGVLAVSAVEPAGHSSRILREAEGLQRSMLWAV